MSFIGRYFIFDIFLTVSSFISALLPKMKKICCCILLIARTT